MNKAQAILGAATIATVAVIVWWAIGHQTPVDHTPAPGTSTSTPAAS